MLTFEFDPQQPCFKFTERKKMTAKAALCQHLLDGHTLNIKNCFSLIGLTNCPREISRMVEQPFGVNVSRVRREGVSKYGQAVTWVDYHLNAFTDHNKEGVAKMKEYVALSAQKLI